jgi:hypothetical protein
LPFDAAPNDVIFNKSVVSEEFDKRLTFGVGGQFFLKQKIFQGFQKGIGVLSLSEFSGIPLDGVNDIPGKVICRHFTSFFIHDVEVVRVHDFLEAVESFGMHFS